MKKLYNLFVLVFIGHSFVAQVVKGSIVNAKNKPIEGANVTVLGKMDHTHTDENGQFEISTNRESDTLIVFSEGYLPFRIILSQEQKSEFNIRLLDDVFFLESVDIEGNTSVSNQLVNLDLTTNTKNSTQELLTLVPGLFVAQHAGGGKSEQMFLRGFDLDHGTDISISSDNVPVNMISHAHGQGYTDLHFLIPELIESISFEKGPYDLKKGNFATAGYVDFKTKDKLDKNQFSIGYGSFNSKLISGAVNVLNDKNKGNAYVAASFNKSEGYFESPQYLTRVNVFGKYSNFIKENVKLNMSASLFHSTWNASGQIPERAVRNGSITRFGAIDNTEGGETSRKNVHLGVTAYLPKHASITTSMYVTQSDFELYSNFTFFHRDSINGDQIRQKENRLMYGFNTDYEKSFIFDKSELKFLTGMGIRVDEVNDLELSYTKNRMETLENVQLGNLAEANYFAYLGSKYYIGKLKLKAGVRAEELVHRYEDLLDSNYTQKEKTLSAFLPKVEVIYTLTKHLNLFAKWGKGFHSNDSRLVLNSSELEYLPLANSFDVGFDLKASSKVILNFALWHMNSQQEFIYVGDEGVVELGESSIRKGVDLGLTYQPIKQLNFNINANYNHARSTGENEQYIPLAPPITVSGSAKFKLENGIAFSWNTRFMGDRPADEFNTVIASGYVVSDVSVGFYKKTWNISAICSNIFNTEWNETQFLTTSKLKNEPASVEEIHFTPGTPIGIKLKFSYLF